MKNEGLHQGGWGNLHLAQQPRRAPSEPGWVCCAQPLVLLCPESLRIRIMELFPSNPSSFPVLQPFPGWGAASELQNQ